jgi:hypothetical protein
MSKAQTEFQPYIDTLNFEYEGDIQEHERIIVRVLSAIMKLDKKPRWWGWGLYKNIRYITNVNNDTYDKIKGFPLITSYEKKISALAYDYLKKNAKMTQVKNIFGIDDNVCKLPNWFCEGSDNLEYESRGIAHFYIYVFMFENFGLVTDYGLKIFSIAIDLLEDENFRNLVSKASKEGIKATATTNGFYSKKLAIKLGRGIVYNKMKYLYHDKNKSLAYKACYIADLYSALGRLSDNSYHDYLERCDEILEKIEKMR